MCYGVYGMTYPMACMSYVVFSVLHGICCMLIVDGTCYMMYPVVYMLYVVCCLLHGICCMLYV